MAEILVKAIDGTNPDPAIDRRCYKRGHPVVVKEDGHAGWGKEEGPPKFIVIKLPGVPKEEVEKYIEEWTEVVGRAEDGSDIAQMVERRKWKIDLDSLPSVAQEALSAKGELVIKASPGHKGQYDVLLTDVANIFIDRSAIIKDR